MGAANQDSFLGLAISETRTLREKKPAGNELLSLGTHFLALVPARTKCRWIFLAILL